MTVVFVCFAAFQSSLLAGIMVGSGVLKRAEQNEYRIFSEKVNGRKNNLENEMNNIWTNFDYDEERISRYFEELAGDMEGACYGQYFLEMADYYTRENVDGGGMLLLIYQSLRAILKPRIPNELVRRVFELKAMVVNGEYTERPPVKVSDSAGYTWEYVVASPVEKLYTFVVTDSVLEEFGRCVDQNKGRYIDREFHSLEILKALTARDKRGKTAGETV